MAGSGSNELVFVPGKIKRETGSAWLLVVDDPTGLTGSGLHGREIWFPKSQCELHDDGLEVPDWLWQKKIEEAE